MMLQLAITILSIGIVVAFIAAFGLSTGVGAGLLVVLGLGFLVGLAGIALARTMSSPAATQRRLRQA